MVIFLHNKHVGQTPECIHSNHRLGKSFIFTLLFRVCARANREGQSEEEKAQMAKLNRGGADDKVFINKPSLDRLAQNGYNKHIDRLTLK